MTNLHHPASTTEPFAPTLPDAGEWFVLHTRSRQEKALAADLAARRVGHFLPLIKQMRQYGRRKMPVQMPMFPGYLFLRGSLEQVYEADRTRRVSQIIRVSDQSQMDWELRNISQALSRDVVFDPYPHLTRGRRVEVRSGPMRGIQGRVEDHVKPDRLLLQVEMLGRAMSVEIDGALLDCID
ncbi:MAG: transcription termination/antitermination NusG family protein [Phycisphaeraceae bacterium]